MSEKRLDKLAIIGLGEVGQILATDLERAGSSIATWDRLFPMPGSVPANALQKLTFVQGADGLRAALVDASVVISAVTAGECVAVAREASSALRPRTYYLDLNSVSPAAKSRAAGHIDDAGGRYVEAAVMSPIAPKRIGSPILLGGPHAKDFLPVAHGLGFRGAELFSDTIGRASAAKMCRSIMIKGLEALLTESLLSARHYGVEQTVLDSLHDLLPNTDWRRLARYMMSRSVQHGRRRAEEMREAAKTAAEAGLTPWMSSACAERQAWAADHGDLLDALLEEKESA